MPGLVDINGNPYTTATEDMRLAELKKQFMQVLGREMRHLLATAKPGQHAEVQMGEMLNFIDQAYYMGREDQR
jgi:hypothetical protein